MKNWLCILLVALGFLWTSACHAKSQDETARAVQNICTNIKEMYEHKTLKNIMVGSSTENYKKPFFADIDNDGKNEEFQYFYTRTYAYVAEIVDGKTIGLPMPKEQTANYSGNAIIKYDGEFLQFHAAHGPFEVQELIELTPEEKMNRPKLAHQLYRVKTLCKYYKD